MLNRKESVNAVIELLVILQLKLRFYRFQWRINLSMKYFFIRLISIAIISISYSSVSAQNNFWKDVLESKITVAHKQRTIVPHLYRTLSLDTGSLAPFLKTI